MKTELLNKILKDILFLTEIKSPKEFKIGELIEGRILKKFENFFLIQLKNKGIVKAYSKVPISGEKILLKVVKNEPQPEMKIISELSEDIKFEEIKDVYKKSIPLKTLSKFLKINHSDFSNPDLFKAKLKDIPKKLGLFYEKEIYENKKVNDSMKKEAFLHKDVELINFIENFQKISNENILFFPVFFDKIKNFEKALVGFKKNQALSKDDIHTVVIDLNLSNNTHIQSLIFSQNKTLQITFSTNNKEFLNLLKKYSNELISSIENITFYKILNISYKFENDEELFLNMLNFFNINNSLIIDIKT